MRVESLVVGQLYVDKEYPNEIFKYEGMSNYSSLYPDHYQFRNITKLGQDTLANEKEVILDIEPYVEEGG